MVHWSGHRFLILRQAVSLAALGEKLPQSPSIMREPLLTSRPNDLTRARR
jgi:hypothetical protein